MKEFEKWFDKYSWTTDVGKRSLSQDMPHKICRSSWKAALERIVKHDPDIGVASCIRKELEE